MAELNFQHHYSNLESNWFFRNHSYMWILCSRKYYVWKINSTKLLKTQKNMRW